MKSNLWLRLLIIAGLSLSPFFSFASEINGASLGLWWAIPFIGILLSIALFPLIAPTVWHHHFGKITALWTAIFLIAFGVSFSVSETLNVVMHALCAEYIPFIILLLSLFTVSGGIYIQGNLRGTPKLNVGILAIGALLASIMGTTGAAMLLIRPLLRANDQRKHNVHIVVFFIFLVANIGGTLTPLGDPPLFLGFLKGVSFFWTLTHLYGPFLVTTVILLALFYVIDSYYFKKEDEFKAVDPTPDSPIKIIGISNFALLGLIVASVLLSGIWKPEVSFTLLGTEIELQNITRDLLLLAITMASLIITKKEIHALNEFSWEPILEVGKLFAGIFITIVPVIAILKAGTDGSMSGIVNLVSDSSGAPNNVMYFWMSGILSAFLDNAPTYLVFFNIASGDAHYLMTELSNTLMAISLGSVFLGAMTYIGNAPNFMVRSIAVQSGVPMPSFFGYMKWSMLILLPIYLLLTVLFLI